MFQSQPFRTPSDSEDAGLKQAAAMTWDEIAPRIRESFIEAFPATYKKNLNKGIGKSKVFGSTAQVMGKPPSSMGYKVQRNFFENMDDDDEVL
ncbi:Protein of unknown function [Pyronema omphalodes CBS 100304]|uniref:Uncharacterized protein n=1 Tax=Pyronema omphalodes (strain CBS 100304) TaxID=1076935 RepID=U4LNR2_PYROM|nr:Protein of unknown function [Pyronema omphalodes CBS 100304]